MMFMTENNKEHDLCGNKTFSSQFLDSVLKYKYRTVLKVSSQSGYHDNWICSLDIIWHPIRGELIVHTSTNTNRVTLSAVRHH